MQRACYKNLREPEIFERMMTEGFAPLAVDDPPGGYYPPHQHPETELLVFLAGGMEVLVQDQTYHCRAGDRLLIPGNVEHTALVHADGCAYFWAEKLIAAD
jgi:quercetin dioxygenase-like cupin family protein